MLTFQQWSRIFACLLVAGLDLTRIVHSPHAHEHVATGGTIAHSTQPGNSNRHPDAPPAHDSHDCQICHFIATGSAAIEAARPAIVAAAPPIDRRIPSVFVEPHSADIDLPCAARAPPVV